MNIWDRLLKRPDDVDDVYAWVRSGEWDKYLLRPHSTQDEKRNRRGDIQADSLIISSVAIPYKKACKELDFNPFVYLPKEYKKVLLSSLSNSSVVTHNSWGTVTLLDNSYLVDANDSHIQETFLREMENHVEECLLEQSGAYDVLCKTEKILKGHTNKFTNTQVLNKFLALTIDSPSNPLDKWFADKTLLASSRLLDLLTGMISQGLILQRAHLPFSRGVSSITSDPLITAGLIRFFKESTENEQ